MNPEIKGEFIQADFKKKNVISREDYISTALGYTGAENLRNILTSENATREELLDQAAYISAQLELVKSLSEDELEIQDLEFTSRECLQALGPITNGEIDRIDRKTKEILEELIETIEEVK